MELVANRSVIEAEVRKALRSGRSNRSNSVLLLRAAPQWRGDETRFAVDVDGSQVPVVVAPCATVLALLDALSASRTPGEHLVILTQCDTDEVGDSVLAQALQPEIKPIDRWDLVRDAFGARQLDPLLTKARNSWIAEALLDAQPAGGWRRLGGPVLTEATALNRLAATRLGIEDADDAAVDAAALLLWTTDSGAVAGFLALPDGERRGLIDWLTTTVGPVADVIFRMAPAGRVADAVPFGLVAAALYSPGSVSAPASASTSGTGGPAADTEIVLTARIRAEERYLGGQPDGAERLRALREALRLFGEAAESLVSRWADNGHAPQAAALRERAEPILAELTGAAAGAATLAGRSRVLDAGLDARLAAFAAALGSGTPSQVAAALVPVQEHARGRSRAEAGEVSHERDRAAEVRAAEAAARLVRWLAVAETPPVTLSGAATQMLRSWAWADQAAAAITRTDTGRVPGLGDAYASLCHQVRARRARLDESFAHLLAAWTETSSSTGDLLLVENLLDRVARPLAGKRPPVIVVLDGMTAGIGAQLAGDLVGSGSWVEAGRRPDGREPALATVPSVTSVARTSLLTGSLQSGSQAEERTGFAAFWGRQPTALFHKADLIPGAGRALADRVRDAILDTATVVGVVLNTIDDTLDRGKPGPARWSPGDVTYLQEILDEARRAGRPVILTADHGHVLSREQPSADRSGGPGEHANVAAGTAQTGQPRPDSARYRAGTPGLGEIAVRGPRVLVPGTGRAAAAGAAVVAAVSESIHYTPRKAGYHGGAAAAEVVVPAITLLPSETLLPAGWYAYDPIGHAPDWWDASSPEVTQPAAPAAGQPAWGRPVPKRRRPAAAPDDGDALFGVSEVSDGAVTRDGQAASAARSGRPLAGTLGARVAASPRMASQRGFVRRAPDDASVAALIDALDRAGNRLTIAEAARAVGEPPVRMSRYLTQIARLLNVDGYAVLRVTDEGRAVEQNTVLLKEQFGL